MYSFLNSFFKIENPDNFLNDNENNIYIYKTIGIQDFDDNDDLGNQLKNLQLEYKFNINETIVMRTFCTKDILIYIPMDIILYYIKFSQSVLNSYIVFNNIIIFYFKDHVQLVDIKEFKTKLYKIDNFSLEMLYTYSEKFKKNNEGFDVQLENIDYKFNLKSPEVINIIDNSILINDQYFKCEKIWSTFIIQKKNCFCISLIQDKTRCFKYIINLNNNKEKIFSLYEFINFLNKSFYSPLKNRIFLY